MNVIGNPSLAGILGIPEDVMETQRATVALEAARARQLTDDALSQIPAGSIELVALMIRAAHTFGLTVVAEGVEEPAQLARLEAQECDQAQGFLLYRPMRAAEAGALLRKPKIAGSV